jgi:hypothetical protein
MGATSTEAVLSMEKGSMPGVHVPGTPRAGAVNHQRAIEILVIVDRVSRLHKADETQEEASLTEEQALEFLCILAKPLPDRASARDPQAHRTISDGLGRIS